MRRRHIPAGRVLVFLAAIFVVGITVAPAAAAEVTISVGAPQSVSIGDRVVVRTVVSAGGEPVEGAVISLSYPAALGGFEGRVELDREVTDAGGVAILEYEQRAADNGEMAVAYVGPEDVEAEPLTFTIAVKPGAEQQFRSEAGLSIWWLNGWLVIGVILTIWALIIYSALQLVWVGREGTEELADAPPLENASEAGSTWLSVILAGVTIFTAIGMGLVFLRNPITHANLAAPEGYVRTPIAHVDDEFPFLGPGLEDPSLAETGEVLRDGRLLYFGFGCSGCHAPGAVGGTVGPPLEAGDVDDFMEDVRQGVKGMPLYRHEVLTDDELAAIYAYIDSLDIERDD